ncbi:Phosphatidylinositol (PI) 3-kinase [Dimargaris verticillata]|uniref:Phosphatidylinositol 3-kinase VPS34 n=1 Tax=Dimargaris verticillata TaxID=2761393 RepID=A0A9W8B910_9FUNG|nr:Phosphatidylinositol (PI) 3-kinase [Dimargaris verticillata]
MEYPSSSGAQFKDFSYCLTREVDQPVTLKIAALEGNLSRSQDSLTRQVEADLAQLALNEPSFAAISSPTTEHQLFATVELFADGYPLCVPYQTPYKSGKSTSMFNEWVTLPIRYRDLPLTAQLVLNVWTLQAPRQVVILGGSTLPLFTHNHKLRQGRQKLRIWEDQLADPLSPTQTPGKKGHTATEMDRLEKLMKKHENGDLPRLDWLDKLAFREIERVHQHEAQCTTRLFLYVELPRFDFPLVYSETESTDRHLATPMFPGIAFVHDPELHRENLVEAKHRRLIRGHRSGPLDRDLKPNAKLRDDLNKILKYPPTKVLTNEEKDLVWKFRFYLSRDKKALTKFIQCVAWTDSVETKQAVDILAQWADIDVDDALEMLGPSYTNRQVRAYAVTRLRRAEDDELLLYLLQLVQALRFEGIDTPATSTVTGTPTGVAATSVPNSSPRDSADARRVEPGDGRTRTLSEDIIPPSSNLATFLIERALKSPVLGNYFHWYLMVECEDKVVGKMYGKVAYQYMKAMMELSDGQERRDMLRRQGELIATLSKLSLRVRHMKEARPTKIEYLQKYIRDPKHQLHEFAPLPLPLDPTMHVVGLVADQCTIFKSSMMPLALTFRCDDGSTYRVMFKTGDDLRQDQLVIQLFTLMDRLLRQEKLDLKLTPYKVLATGTGQGLVQLIPSDSLAAILAEHNDSLLSFLRKDNPDPRPSAPLGVTQAAMDTYIKSCAGYCVITYLLAVGDRHLDNLLLTTDGRLFHIDFGYILGRDPKPFPPPMKLCKEMVEGMGGASSLQYQRFKSYCFVAFSVLRKSANLILSLLALMVQANIPDIAIEPDQAVAKVQNKFRLDMSEEEATQYFQALITESVSALFPQVIETIHRWAMYWKK